MSLDRSLPPFTAAERFVCVLVAFLVGLSLTATVMQFRANQAMRMEADENQRAMLKNREETLLNRAAIRSVGSAVERLPGATGRPRPGARLRHDSIGTIPPPGPKGDTP